MARHSLALSLALLMLGASLAGCLGGDEPLDPSGWEGCSEGDPDVDPESCIDDQQPEQENNTSENTSVTEPIEPNLINGTWEGMLVPNIEDQARSLGGTWQQWSLSNLLDTTWNGTPNGVANGSDSPWVLIEFASTDCSHCWNVADDMNALHDNYSAQVTFLTFAVNFSSNDYFNASLEEIAAFQDQTSHAGCRGNSQDCASRPGEPHNWDYVDDRDQTWMYEFHSQGTPMFVILSPDGVVAWHQYQHDGEVGEDSESVEAALERFFGPMDGGE